jgi:hypothetical protein
MMREGATGNTATSPAAATVSARVLVVRSHLESLSGEVCASLDKVDGREHQVNSQLEGLLGSYRDARLQLNDMQEEFSRCACSCFWCVLSGAGP